MPTSNEVKAVVIEFITKQLTRLPMTKSGEPRRMIQFDEGLRAPDGSLSYVKSGFSRERARTMAEGLGMKLSTVFNQTFDAKAIGAIIDGMTEASELSSETRDYSGKRSTYHGLAGTTISSSVGAGASDVVRALDL